MKRKSFTFYLSWSKPIKLLSESQKAQLLDAILAYVSGEEPVTVEPNVKMCFEFIKSEMEEDAERAEKAKEQRIARRKAKEEESLKKRKEKEKETKEENTKEEEKEKQEKENAPKEYNNIYNINTPKEKENKEKEGEKTKEENKEKEEKEKEKKNNDYTLARAKEEKNWRNDFDTYLKELKEETDKILCDAEWLQKQKEFNNPDLDIIKSIECAVTNYWGTHEGWENKKKSKTKTINWKSTFAKTLKLPLNRVFYPKNFAGAREFKEKETMTEKVLRVGAKIWKDMEEGRDDSLFGMIYNKKY